MANLQTTTVNGFTNLCQASATPSVAGRLWYDNSSCSLKYSWCGTLCAWSIAPSMLENWFGGSAVGTNNASLVMAGLISSPTNPGTPTTEKRAQEFNGTSWSLTNNMNWPHRCSRSGFGTQNSAVIVGGLAPAEPDFWLPGRRTDVYNGNTFSNGPTIPYCSYNSQGAGDGSSGILIAGNGGANKKTQEWFGTYWSSGGCTTHDYNSGAAAGTQNAALVFGYVGPLACSEEYNGSSWANLAAIPVYAAPLVHNSGAGGGTQNAAWAAGAYGFNPACSPSQIFSNKTAEYNGTTWSSTNADLVVGVSDTSGDGSSTQHYVAAGNNTAGCDCKTLVQHYNQSTGFQVCEL